MYMSKIKTNSSYNDFASLKIIKKTNNNFKIVSLILKIALNIIKIKKWILQHWMNYSFGF